MNASTAEDPVYLTTSEVIERFRGMISDKTLANWRTRGEGPPFMKAGGRVLYPLAALIEWENKRTTDFARPEKAG
jgi:hypothetical protein